MEDWKGLIEGVRLHPGLHPAYVTVLKDDLDEASQEDIRVIWDALQTDGQFSVGDLAVWKEGGEDGWTSLTEVMEMSKEEWAQVEADLAQVEAQDEDDGEAEEEGEGEDESEEEGEAEEEGEGEDADGAFEGDHV